MTLRKAVVAEIKITMCVEKVLYGLIILIKILWL